ncbi:FAD-binding domain-containing protein [Colletotrichum asianum]
MQRMPNLRAVGIGLLFLLQESLALSAGCRAMAQACADLTFKPGSAVYEYEKRHFWSNTREPPKLHFSNMMLHRLTIPDVEILNPSCIFIPTSAHQVSTAINTIKSINGSFAVRGGGHTAISGANSTDEDVLLVFSNRTELELSDQRSHVHLGPGLRWGEVYNALEPYDLTVAGGRVAPVGVPGLLLAGGIGFYSNKYGFSANTVSSYEVVLADGRIVNATASNEYSDLFWPLKGGGPNFGLVTSFELQAIPSPRVFAGVLQFESSQFEAFFEAVAAYSVDIFDTKSHIIPIVGFARDDGTDEISSYAYIVLFYDDPDETEPGIFRRFLDIPNVGNTLSHQTVANLAFETGKSYDDVISAWIEKTVQTIDSATAEAGLHHPFRYMGDSAAFQVAEFFDGYPQGVAERLDNVALKYDPDGFFQKNMPGGFKLSASKVSSNDGVGGVDGTESYDAGILKQGDGRVSGLHGFDVPLQRLKRECPCVG